MSVLLQDHKAVEDSAQLDAAYACHRIRCICGAVVTVPTEDTYRLGGTAAVVQALLKHWDELRKLNSNSETEN